METSKIQPAAIQSLYAGEISDRFRSLPKQDPYQWEPFRDIVSAAALKILGDNPRPRVLWVSSGTLALIQTKWVALLRGEVTDYKMLNRHVKRHLRHELQNRAEDLAAAGEKALATG